MVAIKERRRAGDVVNATKKNCVFISALFACCGHSGQKIEVLHLHNYIDRLFLSEKNRFTLRDSFTFLGFHFQELETHEKRVFLILFPFKNIQLSTCRAGLCFDVIRWSGNAAFV